MAGALLGPLLAVQVGMGENILILAFVVIVIGGIGSIRGALVGALLVGWSTPLGRTLLPALFARVPAAADGRAPPARRWPRSRSTSSWRRCCDPAAGPVPGARLMRRHAPSIPLRLAAALGAVAALALLPLACTRARPGLLHQLRQPDRDLRRSPRPASTSSLGYGGMVSFGHAAFFGLGAYAIGDADAARAWSAAWLHLAGDAVAVTALAALVIGAISLRTRGVYFIMITLAFAQMLYYLVELDARATAATKASTCRARSSLGFGLDLKDATDLLLRGPRRARAALCGAARASCNSRFGRAVRRIRDNETRMPRRSAFRPTAAAASVFVVAGAVGRHRRRAARQPAGLRQPEPAALDQSGTLMVMVILGGVATLWGGVLGAAVLLLLQEVLAELHRPLAVLDRLGAARGGAVRAPGLAAAGRPACGDGDADA